MLRGFGLFGLCFNRCLSLLGAIEYVHPVHNQVEHLPSDDPCFVEVLADAHELGREDRTNDEARKEAEQCLRPCDVE